MREIGSEFWQVPAQPACGAPPWQAWPGELCAYVSGRTALYAVLDDLLPGHNYKSAYLPSYCCATMIEPFVRHGLDVFFYPVTYADGALHMEIKPDSRHAITLVMDYFGFSGYAPKTLPDTLLIRDLTHSLLSEDPAMLHADYLYASLRKWGAVSGAAIACKTSGSLAWAQGDAKRPSAYIRLREEAYARKAAYMAGEAVEKQSFLERFAEAERLLETAYIGYAADPKALAAAGALGACVKQRRANAAVLLSGLGQIRGLTPLFSQMRACDTPLFVPVLVRDGRRDALKRHLIERRIYCPTHWPLCGAHRLTPEEKALYDQELSLVCDQRYGEAEMTQMLTAIAEFMG